MKSEKTPLLSVQEYGLKVSIGSTEWKNFRHSTINHFHINTIQNYIRLSKLQEFPIPPHRKEVFDFIFLTRGKVARSKSLDEYLFSRNQFFFLPAYQITAMRSMTSNASGYYCHFSPEIFYKKLFQEELLQQFSFMHFSGNPVVEVDAETADFAGQLLCRLEDEYKKDDQCDIDLVASLLLSLFFAIKRFAKPIERITDNAAYRIARQYKALLQKHLFEHQKVGYYAQELAVTPEHLNRSVKAAFGRTAHHYLDEMILLEAKVLLRQSALNVSEIAYKVGKENPGDFIRFFKTKTGITPKQYRNQI